MAEQDVKENEMTSVDSVDYVRGLKGKDSVLIAINYLFSDVVRERDDINDANNAINSGLYRVNSAMTNIPYSGNGILLVLKAGTLIIQLYYQGIVCSQRRSGDNGVSWGDWRSITFT